LLSVTKPTNSPEESPAILKAGITLSSCLETDRGIGAVYRNTLPVLNYFSKTFDDSLEVSPITWPLMMLPVIFTITTKAQRIFFIKAWPVPPCILGHSDPAFVKACQEICDKSG
jgi:hypothetical protein